MPQQKESDVLTKKYPLPHASEVAAASVAADPIAIPRCLAQISRALKLSVALKDFSLDWGFDATAMRYRKKIEERLIESGYTVEQNQWYKNRSRIGWGNQLLIGT